MPEVLPNTHVQGTIKTRPALALRHPADKSAGVFVPDERKPHPDMAATNRPRLGRAAHYPL